MTRQLTMDQLRIIMRTCAGADDETDLDGEIGGLPFGDLGYDSLAVLEIQKVIELEFGIGLPDEALEEMTTPERTVAYVNTRLLQAA